MTSPLFRYLVALIVSILLLMFVVTQLYRLFAPAPDPVIEASIVLDTVQQLSEDNAPLQCTMSVSNQCEHALFVSYPAGSWESQERFDAETLISLVDSQHREMLCRVGQSGELLCINQLNWPKPERGYLNIAYVFYALLFGALFWFSRRLFKDIDVLRNSALEEIKVGRFPQFTLSRHSYLHPLAVSLQNLTGRITELTRFQTEMAETVCHDIKTPLARLKLINHMLDETDAALAKEQIASNIEDIEDNIYDYLRLAVNDYKLQPLERELIPLRAYLEERVRPFKHNDEVVVTSKINNELYLFADEKLLSRALNNLISNAIRFAHHSVVVQAVPEEGLVHLIVEDDGDGWLAKSEQRRNQEHHQMGLSIVRRVMEQHGGELTLRNSATGGAMAILTFPQKAPEQQLNQS